MVNIKFEDVISGTTRLESMKNSLNKTEYCLRETTARCGALNYFTAGGLGISIRPQNVHMTSSARNTQTSLFFMLRKKNLKQVCQNVRLFFVV